MLGISSLIYYISNNDINAGHDGLIIEVIPNHADSWIGIFAFGSMLSNSVNEVICGPGLNSLTVVSRGNGYIIDVTDPSKWESVKAYPVLASIPIPNSQMILFHDYTELIAYDKNGFLWKTKQLSWDGIIID